MGLNVRFWGAPKSIGPSPARITQINDRATALKIAIKTAILATT